MKSHTEEWQETALIGGWQVVAEQTQGTQGYFGEETEARLARLLSFEEPLYIIAHPHLPFRYLGYQAATPTTVPTFWDLRIDTSQRCPSLFFSFARPDSDLDPVLGSGQLQQNVSNDWAGMLMPFIGHLLPMRWKQVKQRIPKAIREEIHAQLDVYAVDDGDFDPFAHRPDQTGVHEFGKPHGQGQDASLAGEIDLEKRLSSLPGTLKNLRESGYYTVQDVLQAKDSDLLNVRSVGRSRLYEIRRLTEEDNTTRRSSKEIVEAFIKEQRPSYVINRPEAPDPLFIPDAENSFENRSFRFRIAPDQSRGQWQEVEILGCQDLDSLHQFLVESFQLEEGKTYAFYPNDSFKDSAHTVFDPEILDSQSSAETNAAFVQIHELGLDSEGLSEIGYAYDYEGEAQHYRVRLTSISKYNVPATRHYKYPRAQKS